MGSYAYGKTEVVEWIERNFPIGATCLDVGACDGKWAKLLNGYLTIDACEVFQPNITNHGLSRLYRQVFWKNISDLEYEWYDLVIFGDVIEHMTVGKAQRVIDYAREHCKDMVIAVPWLYSQGAEYGNPYEVHLQPDLTLEIFNQRYPGFTPIWINNEYAYFHKL